MQIANSNASAKRKRRPAGTPDPDAEVVSLSPRTLLESDRYVCEICNQGFQRDQNLQMHRRRHKVPWKLLKREAGEAARKRVFVCPEPTCLHHDPAHALGDLVGIKKHFRRKHSGHRQWACSRCSKAYAVHSDYKAHLKTCGTRGHTCDCGRVFSRVESFIEHQDMCDASRPRGDTTSSSPGHGGGRVVGVAAASNSHHHQLHAASLSRTASSASPSSGGELVGSPVAWPCGPATASPTAANVAAFHRMFDQTLSSSSPMPSDRRSAGTQNLELQLMPPRGGGAAPPGTAVTYRPSPRSPAVLHAPRQLGADAVRLQLSIGCGGAPDDSSVESAPAAAATLKEESREQLRLATAEMASAEDTRAQARRQVELAEQELAGARRVRQQAQLELSRAHALRDHAVRQIDATLMEITCYGCRHNFRARAAAMNCEVASYVSSVLTEGGDTEVDNDGHHQLLLHAEDLPRSHRAMMEMDIN
ncbi:protein indeterminate-domain 16-like [Lolium rigidum]|uniref:protein indeterminate-domain 16-like n=1 Tax=Lolium rigidum TaxID=89674 RepID=UPI001F5C43B0|nr:protein indeterminate-domain 16-like [Lolium rigidum]